MEFDFKLKIGKCTDHPKYQVKLKPRSNCEWCWLRWSAKVFNRLSHAR